MYVPESLRLCTMELHHDFLSAGHFGVSKTVDMIKRAFYWPSMYSDVYKFVRSCPICCKSKVPKHKPYGLLIPLSTSARAWSDISVDFIVELPRSRDMILWSLLIVLRRLHALFHLDVFQLLLLLLTCSLLMFSDSMAFRILLFPIVVLNSHPIYGKDSTTY